MSSFELISIHFHIILGQCYLSFMSKTSPCFEMLLPYYNKSILSLQLYSNPSMAPFLHKRVLIKFKELIK